MATEIKKIDEKDNLNPTSGVRIPARVGNLFKSKSKKTDAQDTEKTSEKVAKESDAPFHRLYANVFGARSKSREGINTLKETNKPSSEKAVAGTEAEYEKPAKGDAQAEPNAEEAPLPPKSEEAAAAEQPAHDNALSEAAGVAHRLSANINKFFKPKPNSAASANVENTSEDSPPDSSTSAPAKAGLRLPKVVNNLFQSKAKDEASSPTAQADVTPEAEVEGAAAEKEAEPATEGAKAGRRRPNRIGNLLKARPKAVIVVTPPAEGETTAGDNQAENQTPESAGVRAAKLGRRVSNRVGTFFKPEAKSEPESGSALAEGTSNQEASAPPTEVQGDGSPLEDKLSRRLSKRVVDLINARPKKNEKSAPAEIKTDAEAESGELPAAAVVAEGETATEGKTEQPPPSAFRATQLARRLSSRASDLFKPKPKAEEGTLAEGEATAESQPEQPAASTSTPKATGLARQLTTRAGDLFKAKPKAEEVAPTEGEVPAEGQTEKATSPTLKATQLARRLSTRAGDLFKPKPRVGGAEAAETTPVEGETTAENLPEQPPPPASPSSSKATQLARRLSTRAGDLFKPKPTANEVAPTEGETATEGQTTAPSAFKAAQLARRLSTQASDLFKPRQKAEHSVSTESIPAESAATEGEAAEVQPNQEQTAASTSTYKATQLAHRLSTRAGDLFKQKPKADQAAPVAAEAAVETEATQAETKPPKATPLARRLSTRAADIFKPKSKADAVASSSKQAEVGKEDEAAATEGGGVQAEQPVNEVKPNVAHRLSTRVGDLFKSKGKPEEGEAPIQEGEASSEQPATATLKATQLARQLSTRAGDLFKAKPKAEETPAVPKTEEGSGAEAAAVTGEDPEGTQPVSEATPTLSHRLSTRVGDLFKHKPKAQEATVTQEATTAEGETNADATQSEQHPPLPTKPRATLTRRLSSNVNAFLKADLKADLVPKKGTETAESKSEVPAEATTHADATAEGTPEKTAGTTVKATELARRLSTRAQDLFKPKPKAEVTAATELKEGETKVEEAAAVEGTENQTEQPASSPSKARLSRRLSQRVGSLFVPSKKAETAASTPAETMTKSADNEGSSETQPKKVEEDQSTAETIKFGRKLSAQVGDLFKSSPKVEEGTSASGSQQVEGGEATKDSGGDLEKKPEQSSSTRAKAAEAGRQLSTRATNLLKPKPKLEAAAPSPQGEVKAEADSTQASTTPNKATEIGRRLSLRVNEIFSPKPKNEGSESAPTKTEEEVETEAEPHPEQPPTKVEEPIAAAATEGASAEKSEEPGESKTEASAGKGSIFPRRLTVRISDLLVPKRHKVPEVPLPPKKAEHSHEVVPPVPAKDVVSVQEVVRQVVKPVIEAEAAHEAKEVEVKDDSVKGTSEEQRELDEKPAAEPIPVAVEAKV